MQGAVPAARGIESAQAKAEAAGSGLREVKAVRLQRASKVEGAVLGSLGLVDLTCVGSGEVAKIHKSPSAANHGKLGFVEFYRLKNFGHSGFSLGHGGLLQSTLSSRMEKT